MLVTEYHCHILPGIDDGAKDADMSLEMIEMMKNQGVSRICATPHFYAHREKSVSAFLQKRRAAYEKIRQRAAVQTIFLGAEIAIEHGISELPEIEKLAIEGTDLILLEFPYRPYEKWMSEEIYNIAAEYKLTVMLAHVHRYLEYYSKDEIRTILNTKAILQLNNEAFSSWKEKKIAKRVISGYEHFAFGSDAHNVTTRKPNWDLLQKKVRSEIIETSNAVLDRHRL